MESLANYGSDDESGDYSESVRNDNKDRHYEEDDANYDEVGMDESSEESNNNHTENSSSIGRDRGSSYGGWISSGENRGSSIPESSSHVNQQYSSQGFENNKTAKFDKDQSSRSSLEEDDGDSREGSEASQGFYSNKDRENAEGYGTKRLADAQRRHSSDMEMDDGGDDLDNYINTMSSEIGVTETTEDFRQKYSKSTIFTKGKSLGEEEGRKSEVYSFSGSSAFSDQPKSGQMRSKDQSCAVSHHLGTSSFQSKLRENPIYTDEKVKEKKEYDMRDDDGERRRDDYRKKDDRDEKKVSCRRDYEDKTKDGDRDKGRDAEKQRDDKEKRRSPERREYGRKRSHSPEKKDRDRERDRERERDKERERDRDRDRDRDRERDRDRDRPRDRDRDRSHRSSDRRSPKHSRRSSRSPERSWKARKLEKKAAVLNKLGIELKPDTSGSWSPRQLLGEQLKNQIQEVEAKTGVTLPTYYNPGVMNPLKYAQQIQKRKLLWGNKSNESKTDGTGPSAGGPPAVKQWVSATFKGDNDGKMTEKFKRLMGIKDGSSAGTSTSTGKPPETKEIIQKQEELFSNMEAQYQVARMATHTHRGVGLGFGTFQVPPR